MRLDDVEHDFLSVREAAAILRIGINACYREVAQGTVPSVKFGRSIRIPRRGLERLLAEAAGEVDDAEAGDAPPVGPGLRAIEGGR